MHLRKQHSLQAKIFLRIVKLHNNSGENASDLKRCHFILHHPDNLPNKMIDVRKRLNFSKEGIDDACKNNTQECEKSKLLDSMDSLAKSVAEYHKRNGVIPDLTTELSSLGISRLAATTLCVNSYCNRLAWF